MKIAIVILIISALWIGYKLLMANQVKGRKAEIRPFRRESKLKPLGVLTVTLDKIQRRDDGIWFVCPLDKEYSLGKFTFDYVKIKAKSVDDNFNRKKAVIAHVLAGHTQKSELPKFIDLGVVKVL